MVNAKDAKALGGVPPYGFSITKDKKYIINEEEAAIVRLIFKMIAKGYSYRDIATYLNSKGYTKRGKPWNHSITDLLRNEKYKGVYVWNKREGKSKLGKKTNRITKPEDQIIRIPGGCPQIVDTETFDKVQEILKSRTREYAHKGPKSRYLLTGILVCGNCGYAYTGSVSFSGRSKLRRDKYECGGRRRLHICNSKDINMLFLDNYIIDLVNKMILFFAYAPIYKEEVNKYLEKKRVIVEEKSKELERQKKELREEAAIYGQQLGDANEEEYIEITRLIGENSRRRTQIDLEQSKLIAKSISFPKLTIEGVEKMLAFHRAKWKPKIRNGKYSKEELMKIIPRIEITNDVIVVSVDLKELLYGEKGDDDDDWILRIVNDRELVSLGYRKTNVDFSSKKLIDSFRQTTLLRTKY